MNIDWHALFVPQEPILELLLRGSVLYLALFLLLRVIISRRVGAMSMTELLVIVLIADAAQNGMAGEYKSITEGIVLCATVVCWSVALDWLAFHVPMLRDWLEPPSQVLVKNGRLQRQHLRDELITEDELMSQLRQHGIANVEEVRRAYIESDGHISVIKKNSNEVDAANTQKKKTQV